MRPTIPDGARVLIAPMDSPKPGDIAFALTPQGPILHRILQIRGDYGVVGGDLNLAALRRPLSEFEGVAIACITPDGQKKYLRNVVINRVALLFFSAIRLRKRLRNSLS